MTPGAFCSSASSPSVSPTFAPVHFKPIQTFQIVTPVFRQDKDVGEELKWPQWEDQEGGGRASAGATETGSNVGFLLDDQQQHVAQRSVRNNCKVARIELEAFIVSRVGLQVISI